MLKAVSDLCVTSNSDKVEGIVLIGELLSRFGPLAQEYKKEPWIIDLFDECPAGLSDEVFEWAKNLVIN